MIFTTLSDLSFYQSLCPNFADAIAWANQADWAALPTGKHAIDGDRLFVIIESLNTQSLTNDSIWEAHDRYIDIQYILQGRERMGWIPRTDALPVRMPYDSATDKVFYEAAQITNTIGGTMIDVAAGQAVVFFPQDAHAPGLIAGGSAQPQAVKKAVFKVRID